MLSDDEDVVRRIKNFVGLHQIQNVSFALDTARGPGHYDIAQEAEVTAILYRRRKVEANHAFRTGQLSKESVGRISADFVKMAGE
jgi:hypothetical protein